MSSMNNYNDIFHELVSSAYTIEISCNNQKRVNYCRVINERARSTSVQMLLVLWSSMVKMLGASKVKKESVTLPHAID